MELNKKEIDLMPEKEFEDYLTVGLKNFEGVSKYRSVFRAIKRGHVTPNGIVAPNRPFNNRANTSKRSHSRVTNQYKKSLYEHIRNN